MAKLMISMFMIAIALLMVMTTTTIHAFQMQHRKSFQIQHSKSSGLYRPFRNVIGLKAASPIDSNINSNIPTKNRIKDLQEKLVNSGQAGLLAYGILNCVYYISVTAVTWYITIKKFPFVIENSASFVERVQFVLSRLGSVGATVWIGSQITKIFRLSGAVICAPVVDNLMERCQKYFRLKDRNQAFWFLIATIWGTVFLFYGSLILYGTSTLYLGA
jgi:hypothetical protein